MSQLQIINMPAGSGKTTEIKEFAQEWSQQRPHDKLLCVTYTNRAVDELQSGLTSSNVEVSTIHSFLSAFSQPFFAMPEIINLYLETYREKIENRIKNLNGNERIRESNARYETELDGPLSIELISNAITHLYYNDSSYPSLYRGGLSHDDLLSFVALCAKRFPVIYQKISSKYSRVIIDEYQDTNVDVLDFFVKAVQGTHCSLHLYGDRMQQIYPSDTARFNSLLEKFAVERRIVTNFRSSPEIVSTLNRIYNVQTLVQKPNTENKGRPPHLHITSHPDELKTQFGGSETLVLRIHNSSIFSAFGAPNILKTMQKIPAYGFGSAHPAISILSEAQWNKVQDPLIRLLFGLLKIEEYLTAKKYGFVVQMLRRNTKTFGRINLHRHEDKDLLNSGLTDLFKTIGQPDTTIKDVVTQLAQTNFLQPINTDEYLSDEKYSDLLCISFEEVRNTYKHNQHPLKSTQHGVKGEGHESVIFMAESSPNPRVSMAKLFNIWPQQEISLTFLEEFYLKLSQRMKNAEDRIGHKVSDLKKASYDNRAHMVSTEANNIFNEYVDNPLFNMIYGERYKRYFSSSGVTNARPLFRVSDIEGLIAAYKLFYVGCSRARTRLDVIVNIKDLDNAEATKEKFEKLGFKVKTDE